MNQTINKAEKYFLNTYNRYNIVIDRGEGVYLFDDNNKKYLDFASGIAVCGIGYGNEKYKNALKNQIDKITHTSNFFYNKPSADAAEKLCKASGMEKVFFTNSGTEAVEGAMKIAKKYYYNKTGLNEGEIIAMNHSFHGRSMGALSITGTESYRKPFGPLIPNIKFAEFNDILSLKKLLSDKTAAIMLETIQGEGGIYKADESYLEEIRKICDENDILLILDEVQCGMGRTGKLFAYQNYDVMPDVVTCAKALGCGVPVGAFMARGKAKDVLCPGDHGSTYGFSPLGAAAVNAVMDIFKEDHILNHVKIISKYLEEKLDNLKQNHDEIIDRRGMGLMQGLEFKGDVKDIILKSQEKGLLLIPAHSNIIRLVPPLVITEKEVDEMISILDSCL